MARIKITPADAALGLKARQTPRARRIDLGKRAILLAKNIHRKEVRAEVEWSRLRQQLGSYALLARLELKVSFVFRDEPGVLFDEGRATC